MSGTPRILTIDIETSPMKVYTFSLFKPFIAINQVIEHSRVISFAAKWDDEDKVIFRSEYHHGREAMLRQAWALLNEADIVIHFNGDTFDIPHLRREFQILDLPPFSPFQTIDIYKQLKKSLYFSSNKLDYMLQVLGIGAKVAHSGFDLWMHCIEESPASDPNRQKRAWALMRKYNIGDVVETWKLYLETRAYLPAHPNMGLYVEDPGDGITRCSVCQGVNLRREGYRYTGVGKYPRYQCRDCGKWGQEKKAVAFVYGRGIAS